MWYKYNHIKTMTATPATFGELLKDFRIRREFTLRECSQALGIDPSNWSKMERGVNPGPKDEGMLKAWAKHLQLSPEEYATLADYSALSRGAIPTASASDERVLQALPVFFRAARGAKMDDAELEKFVQTVRNLHTRDKDA